MVAEREHGLRAETQAAASGALLPGREHAAAFLITGMPGAGKSTAARLLALRFDQSAHIDIDMVFHHFTVAGCAAPEDTGPDQARQAELAVVNAAAMARNYVAAGYVCVLEGAVATRAQVRAGQQALAPHPLHLVVLAPPPEVSEQRDTQRSGKHVAPYFRHLHPMLAGELSGLGLWLDNSDQSLPETAEAIWARRAEARL
jgi:predicted kinase